MCGLRFWRRWREGGSDQLEKKSKKAPKEEIMKKKKKG